MTLETKETKEPNPKERRFADEYFYHGDRIKAMKTAGYRVENLKTAHNHAEAILRRPHVRNYLRKLWEQAESPIVMSVRERKERLSMAGRADIADYIDDDGNIDLKKIKNSLAVSSVVVSDRYNEDGELIRTTRIKLHNPREFIAELNKMEHLYRGDSQNNAPVINNYFVTSPEVVDKMARIGERTRPVLIEGKSRLLTEGEHE